METQEAERMMDHRRWNEIVAGFPQPHLLQTWEWGQVKSALGWHAHHKIWEVDGKIAAAALVLERTIRLGGIGTRLRMHYIPKGPLLIDWSDAGLRRRVIAELEDFARLRGAFLLKLDPDLPLGVGEPGFEEVADGMIGETLIAELKTKGWHFSDEQVQFRNTVLLDLTLEEEEILAAMKQKTRYNIRLAHRKDVSVRRGAEADFEHLYQMYAETAVRDGFAIRGKDYYLTLWQTFFNSGMLLPLVAEVDAEAVAGLMLFVFGGRCWYLHGMSTGQHRNRMPTYLLQWEAIRAGKQAGCQVYDLWGAPDEFSGEDSLWGVYRFKRGLGGEVLRTVGAWDKPLRPLVFKLYARIWPRIMDLLRARGRSQTKQGLAGG
ncbi:MAG: peptidoglycan bridge formation glycyltransferase FemA/FemB family protein [Anaerolineales bacterium]|nr:peptidoglycan bridge formation glycyltransferase FemA/FemB family protein [Anaerolineales bacterium]